MALVTISEASRLTGKARKTLYAHIKSGKVSSRLGKDKVRRIDTSELARVYDLSLKGNSKVTTGVTSEVTTGNVTSNTITLTPEQLQVIIKNAVAEAIKEVVPLLLENKQAEQVTPSVEVTTPVTEVTTTVTTGSNYLDDIPTFLSKK